MTKRGLIGLGITGLCLSMTAATAAGGGNASHPVRSFNELDRNNDGYLQADELGAYELREADSDKDEVVSREEYYRYIRRASWRQ